MKFLGFVIGGVIIGYLVGTHLAQAQMAKLDLNDITKLVDQMMLMNEYVNNGMLAGGVIGGFIGLFS